MCCAGEASADEFGDGSADNACVGMVQSDYHLLIENCLFGCLFSTHRLEDGMRV